MSMIRLARPDDYPTFARLFAELRVPDPTPAREFFETQMLPLVIVAGEDKGYCFWIEKTGHVSHVVVDPDARNRGIGRAMLDFVRERMRAAGWTHWSLNVKKDNLPAIALYRKCGFEVARERWLLRTTFSDLAKLPASDAEPFDVEPEHEEAIAKRFDFDRARFDLWRAQGGKALLGLRQNDAIAGFASFDPKFPGFSMFHVASPGLAGTLAMSARIKAREDRVHLFLESAELAEGLPGEILNEILYMTGSLEK